MVYFKLTKKKDPEQEDQEFGYYLLPNIMMVPGEILMVDINVSKANSGSYKLRTPTINVSTNYYKRNS